MCARHENPTKFVSLYKVGTHEHRNTGTSCLCWDVDRWPVQAPVCFCVPNIQRCKIKVSQLSQISDPLDFDLWPQAVLLMSNNILCVLRRTMVTKNRKRCRTQFWDNDQDRKRPKNIALANRPREQSSSVIICDLLGHSMTDVSICQRVIHTILLVQVSVWWSEYTLNTSSSNWSK